MRITILPEDFDNSKNYRDKSVGLCLVETALNRQFGSDPSLSVGIQTATVKSVFYRVSEVGQKLISDFCHPKQFSNEEIRSRLPKIITLTKFDGV
jgi:hypothetical protein